MAGLSGLNSLAKSINRAKGGEDFPVIFAEEFELLLKASKEEMARKEDDSRWSFEQGTPYAFHPSNMGACPRCIFYNFMKYEPEPGTTDDVLKDIQDYGTDRHERVQKALVHMPPAYTYIDFKERIPILNAKGINTYIANLKENKGVFGKDFLEYRFFNPDVPLWFKTDGGFIFKGIEGIFEFKTELGFKFNKRIAPEPTHVEQASWYAHCLGMEWIHFRYEIRGELFERKNYLVQVNKKTVEEGFEKVRYIKLHADNNELPPKEEDKKLCEKSYCKHHAKCSRDFLCDKKYEMYLQTRDALAKKALDGESNASHEREVD